MLKVTIKRSTIKATKAQRDTVKGLGLRKLNSSRVLADTPEIRGMIRAVKHLVEAEEVAE